MRLKILIFLLIVSLTAMAQEPPYTPMRSNYRFRGVRIDSLFMPPSFADTATANAIGLNTITGNVIRVDSVIYLRSNGKWVKQGGGATIDTTSLSDRINLRVKYSDTATMLSPYLRKVDTANLSNRINDKIENLIRSSDSVYFYKNGVKTFAYKDSVGGAGSGFVPYTGATQDVDLGANGLDAKFINITGTAGAGHIDFKHQSADATAQGNSSVLYANSQGYPKWKNDNLHYSTFALPQSADRIYTYQNKSYTLGDSADIAARVKYTDTAGMLSPYARSISVVKYTDTGAMLSPYARSINVVKYTDTAAMLSNYAKISLVNTKLNISDTASMLSAYLRKSDSTIYQTKYKSDTSRVNIYNAIAGKVDSVNKSSDTIYYYQNGNKYFAYTESGGGSVSLQDVIDYNHDLVNGNLYMGTSASVGGIENIAIGNNAGESSDTTKSNLVAIGKNAGKNNTGNQLVAIGLDAGNGNVGEYVVAIGSGSGQGNTAATLTAVGLNAGYQNTGGTLSAFGAAAGYSNTGNQLVAIGLEAGSGNTGSEVISIGTSAGSIANDIPQSGNYVVIIGKNAGISNSFDDVILLGTQASATDNHQVSFGKNYFAYQARIDKNGNDVNDATYKTTNANGYLVVDSVAASLDMSEGGCNCTYSIYNPGVYSISEVGNGEIYIEADPAKFPGQQLIIINKNKANSLDIATGTYAIKSKGDETTNINLLALSEMVIAYSDGENWHGFVQ